MPHRLDPLLRPGSLAVLGASRRPGSVGRTTIENLRRGEFAGRLYAVNPRYDEVCGVPCFASLEALPEPVEHVIVTLGDAGVEGALEQVIAHGARAATIMSALELAEDGPVPLRERVARRVRESGLLLCGANGMGFYNFRDRVWACGFATRAHRPGNVAYLSQSGSGMSGIVDVEARLDFSLVVSSGQELAVSLDAYLDFALDMPGTRVVGLFLETARNPEGFAQALAKAQRAGIPVVALKVGRTPLAARLAVSHSGAIAGDDGVYDALFDRYGVQRVADMDELATALIMFAQPHAVGAGGLIGLHDSGGERQLLIDRADAVGVRLATLGPDTVVRLEALLDPGLPAVNPLDAWSAGGANYAEVMAECFAAMLRDPDAALGAVVHDRGPDSSIVPTYVEYLRRGHAASGKPVFLVANRQGTGADALVVETTREGFPVLDGLGSFLAGTRCLLGFREARGRPAMATPEAPAAAVERWRARLTRGQVLDEAESTLLLGDFGIPVNTCRIAESEAAALAAAAELGYPVVLKSAGPGLHHKSRADGVRLGLADAHTLAAAYADLAARLGPRVLVAPMVREAGLELLLGMVTDPQFGPVVLMGFGGASVEALRDVVHLLPPFDAATARRRLAGLRLRGLLAGPGRGAGPDLAAYCQAAAAFSAMVAALADVIDEIDVNPIIVHPGGCLAVDALVAGRATSDPAGGPIARYAL